MFAKSFSAFFTLVLLCGSGLVVLAAPPAPPKGCQHVSSEKVTAKVTKSTLNCKGTQGFSDLKLASTGSSEIDDVCNQYRSATPDCYNPRSFGAVSTRDCQGLINDFKGNANAQGSFNTEPGESTKFGNGQCVFYFVNQSGDTQSFCYTNMLQAIEDFGASGNQCARSGSGGAAQGRGWYVAVSAE